LISTFDSMDDDGILLEGRKILMIRIVRDEQEKEKVCMELVIWGDLGENEFVLRNIVRVPGEWLCADFCTNTNQLYASFDEDCSRIPGDALPQIEDVRRAVFQFPLSSFEDGSIFPQPEFFFLAGNDVSSIQTVDRNCILVGTKVGTIEIWDCRGQSACCTLHAEDSFPRDQELSHNSIGNLYLIGESSLQYGFLSVQENGLHGTIVSLWQTPTLNLNIDFDVANADFQIMAKIKYECYPEIFCGGRDLMMLVYDKFGCLYLDIYHILGSRFALHENDDVHIPKDVDLTNLHPNENGEKRIQFANRINIRHRIDVEHFEVGLSLPQKLVLDANDRFVVISANDGLVGSDGARKSSTGLIVIDLDDY